MSVSSRVLVTGASGYIATQVVQKLLQQGYRVRGTVRSRSNEQKVQPLLDLCPDAKYPLELVETDLTKPEGWLEAVRDCLYVIHIASPCPLEPPKDEQDIIGPAVNGTLHVLRACKEARCVKRVVITSSMSSIQGLSFPAGHVSTEEDWPDLALSTSAYQKSKVLAEKAAWDFVADLPEEDRFELATLNPGVVVGPVLCGSFAPSMSLIKKILLKGLPMIPRLNLPMVDIRDVADAHIAAMTNPEANGHRHIICKENMWMSEVVAILDKEFRPQGYYAPTYHAPYWLMWIAARFDKTIHRALPLLGRVTDFDNSRMTTILGIQPRPIPESLIEMAYSMVEHDFLQKTEQYTGPPT